MDLSRLAIADLGALICTRLREAGVPVTLSGGACAEIYSGGVYVTGDLDLVVNHFWLPYGQTIERVMRSLGFSKSGRVYACPTVAYTVEFPPGPLEIGEECHVAGVERKCTTGTLSLLSAVDCVKDRLAGYFYGNDAQCLEQAVLVCRNNDVDLDAVRAWAANEARPERFNVFQQRVAEEGS